MSSSNSKLSELSREQVFKYLKRSKRLSLQRRIPSLRHMRAIETDTIHNVYFSDHFLKFAHFTIGDMHYKMRPVSATSTGFEISENDGSVSRKLVSELTWEQLLESAAERFLDGKTIGKLEFLIRGTLEIPSLPLKIGSLIIRSSYASEFKLDQLEQLTSVSRLELDFFNCPDEVFDFVSKIKVAELSFASQMGDPIHECSKLTAPMLQVEQAAADFSDFLNMLKNCSTRKPGTYYLVKRFAGRRTFSSESAFFEAIKQEFPNATPKTVSTNDYPSEKALSVPVSNGFEWNITNFKERGGFCRLCTVDCLL